MTPSDTPIIRMRRRIRTGSRRSRSCTGWSRPTLPRARAGDRLRRRRQPDGDGRGDARASAPSGVDLAAEPIAEGQRAIAEIGLTNVEFRQGDVRDLDDGALGEFDYVIAHGVYSWIPRTRATRCWRRSSASLAPDGDRLRLLQRQPRRLLPAHAARRRPVARARARRGRPATQAAKAQELYKFLNEQRVTSADTYGALLEREVPALADAPIYRLVHDDLAEHWHPVWFAEFAEHAAGTGSATSARPTSTACARRCSRRASSPSCGSSPAATGSRSRTTPTC